MRVAGQSPTHGQSEARRGVTAPACKRPAPAVRPMVGRRGRIAGGVGPKDSSLEPKQRHSGLTKACFFCPCSCRRRNWPPFFFFSISIPRWPCRLSVPEPAVDGRCRRRCDPYRCACLPAHASNPADQIPLFPSAVQVVRSHRERLDLLQALASVTRWTRRDSIVTVTTPVTIPAAKMEAAFFSSTGAVPHTPRDEAKSVRVRGPSWPCRLLCWRCRCKAWLSITTRTWLRGNLGESKIRRETRESRSAGVGWSEL